VCEDVTSERCSCIAGGSRGEGTDSDKFFIYWVNMQQQTQCIVCNYCYNWKAINVTNSVFVLVALGVQHMMRMRRIMFISVAFVGVP
jgi:hypothetical protein